MTYYGDNAYNSQAIPPQAKPQARGWLKNFAQISLPWGNTQQVVPNLFFQEHSPNYLRESTVTKEDIAKGVANKTYALDPSGNAIDQQMIRYSPLALRTRILAFCYAMSKGATYIFGFLCFFTAILTTYAPGMETTFLNQLYGFFLMWLPLPLVWLLCYLIVSFSPNMAFGIGSKGMLWELNRRTGIVSIRKNGFSAPFYEWDAYIHSFPGQSGVIFYKLYLIHRYQEYTIDLTYFSPASNIKTDAYAAWDFIQNYMDTSQPIPDIPLLERWRPYDPVTAEYDKQTNRNPNYWLEMDDDKWQQKSQAMQQQVVAINTMLRPNLMVKYYVDNTA